MWETGGLDSALHFAAESMRVHSVGIQVTAHNIANISTGDFVPQRATFVTGTGGAGVELESVRKIPASFGDNVDFSPAAEALLGGKRPSGTELAREIPQMISLERGFQANAATVSANEEMFTAMLDMKI